jgi:hypothetical protein
MEKYVSWPFSRESEMSDTPCKPIFVQSLMDATLNEGDKLKLHAAINALPEPEVSETSHFIRARCRDDFLSRRLFGTEIIFR